MNLQDHRRLHDRLSYCIRAATLAKSEASNRAQARSLEVLESRAQTWLAEELGDLIERTRTQLYATETRIDRIKKTLGESTKP